MRKIRAAFAALLSALALGAATPASAALVDFTLNFTASGFTNYFGGPAVPPYDPIAGSLSFKFDNQNDISPTTSGIQIDNLSLPAQYLPLWSYDSVLDVITFASDITSDGCSIEGGNYDFCTFIKNASTSPSIVNTFYYTTREGSYENGDFYGYIFHTRNVTSNYIVSSGVPEPTTWALLSIGIGAIGWAMRRRKAVPEARRTVLSEGLPV